MDFMRLGSSALSRVPVFPSLHSLVLLLQVLYLLAKRQMRFIVGHVPSVRGGLITHSFQMS
jgi:hypothetical protein